jgi:hypothetical protein
MNLFLQLAAALVLLTLVIMRTSRGIQFLLHRFVFSCFIVAQLNVCLGFQVLMIRMFLRVTAKSWVICSIGLSLFLVAELVETRLWALSRREMPYQLFKVFETLVHNAAGYATAIAAVSWIAHWHRIAACSDLFVAFFILSNAMICLVTREALKMKKQLHF